MVKKLFSRSGAKQFAPHKFSNQITIFKGLPTILIERSAYDDMYILVNQVEHEVGWIGSVEKHGQNFLIKEIFLLDQEVNATTCEITSDGLSEFATEIMSSREDGMDVVNSIRFWGHSHVNMHTSPSAQDDDQIDIFSESCDDFFIRGILNKKGRMEFTLYLFQLGVKIVDCPWSVHFPARNNREGYWIQEIAEKVRERLYVPPRNFSGAEKHYTPGWWEKEDFNAPNLPIASCHAKKGVKYGK